MPAKGWRKPAQDKPTRCPSCSKLLPAAMLQGFVAQLKLLHGDLARSTIDDNGDEVAKRRRAQLAVLHARSTAEILIHDAEHMLCACDGGPKKRVQRAKREPSSVDPSNPPGLETTTVRKRGRRAASPAAPTLRAVD